MESQVKKIDFTDQNIYAGFDAHLKSWKVTVMAEDLVYKTFSQPPRPEVLFNYLKEHFPGGTYHTAYEAGFCGYWIHDKLVSFGIKSKVFGLLSLCCIVECIGCRYTTKNATLTMDKCSPAAANFIRHTWVCIKQYFMTQQGQALVGYCISLALVIK